jgi:streptogrisin C
VHIVGVIVVATSLSVVAVRTDAATGQAAPAPASAPTLDTVEQLAATQLARDEGLPIEEAQRRIDRQQAVEGLAAQAESAVGEAAWAGAYIDHDDGGRLVVQVDATSETASLDADAALATAPDDLAADVVEVEHSLGELEAAQEAVSGVPPLCRTGLVWW